MLLTVEGILEAEGRLRPLEPVEVAGPRRVMVTFLDEKAADERTCPAEVSELALARDWEKPQEVTAWSHLSQLPSL